MSAPAIEQLSTVERAATRHETVLFIIDRLCEMGGAERVLLRIVDRLPEYGYSPVVVTFGMDETLGIRESIRCPLHVLPLRRTYDDTAVRAAGGIRQLVRESNIRIAHTFHETSDLWGGMMAKIFGCPILISSRRDMGFQRQAKHKIAYRWLGKYFDEVQVVSNEVRKFCIENDRLNPDRVRTVYNGINLPPQARAASKEALRSRFGLPTGCPLVVSVGHVRKIKGFDVFLRTAARVLEHRPDAVFAVAGKDHEHEHMNELRDLCRRLCLDRNFFFVGDVDDVPSFLRAADVFCLPSRSEGLSNALLEAMACELPCVATRVGGNPEIVDDGRTGFIFESEDHSAAADRIITLINNPGMAKRMGATGRAIVEQNFTTEAMMQTLVQSYERLLSNLRKNG